MSRSMPPWHQGCLTSRHDTPSAPRHRGHAMITALFDWLGHLAISRYRRVLMLYAVLLLAALPLLLRLHLEADVRDTLPPDMARALERHNALFGTADLALLLVQTPGATASAQGAALPPGGRDTLLA